MNVKSHKTNVPDIEININKEDIVIISKNKLECLSNAAINGGRKQSDSIVNHHVPLDFDHVNLNEVLKPVKNKYKLSNSMIGLLTAVEMDDAVIFNERIDDIDYTIILTAGLTNKCAPLIEVPNIIENNFNETIKPGTINIILLINGKITEHAMVNLFIVITEAKTYLLNKLGVRMNDGRLATGTSTDTIVIGSTGKRQLIEWSGHATRFGQSIGQTVFKTLNIALKKEVSDKNCQS